MNDAVDQVAAQKGRDAFAILSGAESSYFGTRELDIKMDVFRKIKEGSLDPAAALQSWIMLYEHHQVMKDLKKLVKYGDKASDRITKQLSENE